MKGCNHENAAGTICAFCVDDALSDITKLRGERDQARAECTSLAKELAQARMAKDGAVTQAEHFLQRAMKAERELEKPPPKVDPIVAAVMRMAEVHLRWATSCANEGRRDGKAGKAFTRVADQVHAFLDESALEPPVVIQHGAGTDGVEPGAPLSSETTNG